MLFADTLHKHSARISLSKKKTACTAVNWVVPWFRSARR